MRISQIKLINFVCFLQEEFEFSLGLNIISAKNGGGKSQLFNAFYWTLFGQIYDRKDGFVSAQVDHLIPDYYKANDAPEEFKISVSIRLFAQNFTKQQNNEEYEYEFIREVHLRREHSIFKIIIPPNLRIEYVHAGETFFVEDTLKEELIDHLFPRKIRRFMWYVGETMKDLIDFENGQTLEYALEQISYYPIYKRINDHSESAEEILDRKIEKELKKANKLNEHQENIIKDIDKCKQDISKWESYTNEAIKQSKDLEYDCTTLAEKLKGLDHFIRYKTEMLNIEHKISSTKNDIENLENRTKENLITTWMLNGCSPLIAASKKNLDLLNAELQKVQKTNNPIPTNLPGSDYVQRMIDDCTCYICERTVEPDSDAFKALQRRINDIAINKKHRILEENYTELNRFKNRLSRLLPGIQNEISDVARKKEDLIKKRNKLAISKQNLFVELGIPEDQRSIVSTGASNANNLMQEYDLKMKLKEREDQKIRKYQEYIQNEKNKLRVLEETRRNFISKSNVDMIEEEAVKYARLISRATSTLKSEAYMNMIKEIETKSNELYRIYLSNDPPGRIKIDQNVAVIDFETGEILENLSAAQETARNLSVINSILSLSETKMNVSYPLIMDAPTSDYDPENTISITTNISKSFKQIIIMSKDYQLLSDEQQKSLVKDAGITNYYNMKSIKIDQNLEASRTNRMSVKYKLN